MEQHSGAGFYTRYPKLGRILGGGQSNQSPPEQEHSQELCSMHRTHQTLLPKIVAYPFASFGNPRVWTQIMSLGHTNLSYYKAKNSTYRDRIAKGTFFQQLSWWMWREKWQLGAQKAQHLFYSGKTTLEPNILLSLHT